MEIGQLVANMIEQAYQHIWQRERRVKQRRGQLDRELAERTRYSVSTVAQLRRGHADRFGQETVLAVLTELGRWGRMDGDWHNLIATASGTERTGVTQPQLGFPHQIVETSFFGRKAELAIAYAALSGDQGVGVGIEGIGGIGKTRLAMEIEQRCRELFDHVIIVNARPLLFADTSDLTISTVLEAICVHFERPDASTQTILDLLTGQRVLLILDNLETAAQSQRELIEQLHPLLGRSKLLMTSRHRFPKRVRRIALHGLDQPAAIQFMHTVARDLWLDAFLETPTEQLQSVWEKTGGSPLAMRLVVAQTEEAGLPTVLQRLGKLPPLGELNDEDAYMAFYKHIFHFSWSRLSESARMMLVALAHVSRQNGITVADLNDVIDQGWGAVELDQARADLWRKSFLEIKSSAGIEMTRYFLHPLVVNFIESEIVQLNRWNA